MNLVIGILGALAAVMTGYILHHGPLSVFVDAWTEYIVILGSAAGIFVAANGLAVTKRTIATILHCLQADHFTPKAFLELMAVLYQLGVLARKDGLLALETHIERPLESPIVRRSHLLTHHPDLLSFLNDNLRLLLAGNTDLAYLDDLMQVDLDARSKEAHIVPEAVQGAADAMPALGIVACVLGVVITMGHIGGDAREIGMSVGVALVGTFLGISVSYLVVSPTARAITLRHQPEEVYLACIKEGILRIAAGNPPASVLEAMRRIIPPSLRPTQAEAEAQAKA